MNKRRKTGYIVSGEMGPIEAFHFGSYLKEELAARGWSIAEFVRRIGYANEKEYGIWYLTIELTIEIHDATCRIGQESVEVFARALGVNAAFLLAIERSFVDSGLPCSCEQCCSETDISVLNFREDFFA